MKNSTIVSNILSIIESGKNFSLQYELPVNDSKVTFIKVSIDIIASKEVISSKTTSFNCIHKGDNFRAVVKNYWTNEEFVNRIRSVVSNAKKNNFVFNF